MNIDLQMEGVLDRRIADAIRRGVRAVRCQGASEDEWRMTVWPSDRRGEWDVGIRRKSEWHLKSFTGAIDALPAFVDRTLREYVQSTTDTRRGMFDITAPFHRSPSAILMPKKSMK